MSESNSFSELDQRTWQEPSISLEKKLFTILEETDNYKMQLSQLLDDITHLRVTAAIELMEMCLIYDPELRRSLANSLSTAQNIETMIEDHSPADLRNVSSHDQSQNTEDAPKEDESMEVELVDTGNNIQA